MVLSPAKPDGLWLDEAERQRKADEDSLFRRLWDDLLTGNPKSPAPLLRLGIQARLAGDFPTACWCYREALQLCDGEDEDDERTWKRLIELETSRGGRSIP